MGTTVNSSRLSAASTALNTSIGRVLAAGVDPVTLEHLDINLFRSLRKIGHSRERICSALCLSYAEYDSILAWLQASESH